MTATATFAEQTSKLDRKCKLIEYLDDLGIHQFLHYQEKNYFPNPKLVAKRPMAWRGDSETFALEWREKRYWLDIKKARDILKAYDEKDEHGIGFVITREANISCIDIDYPKDSTPESIAAFERVRDRILAMFPDSYAEFSVSGKGAHIWVLGTVEKDRSRYIEGIKVEIFSNR